MIEKYLELGGNRDINYYPYYYDYLSKFRFRMYSLKKIIDQAYGEEIVKTYTIKTK